MFFFFRLQRLKYPVYTVAGGFVCAKKVWQTQEGTMNSPSLFLIQSRGILLNFSSSPPPPPQNTGSPLFSYRCALFFRFRWPSTLLPCDWLDLRLFWIIACIVYIKLKELKEAWDQIFISLSGNSRPFFPFHSVNTNFNISEEFTRKYLHIPWWRMHIQPFWPRPRSGAPSTEINKRHNGKKITSELLF